MWPCIAGANAGGEWLWTRRDECERIEGPDRVSLTCCQGAKEGRELQEADIGSVFDLVAQAHRVVDRDKERKNKGNGWLTFDLESRLTFGVRAHASTIIILSVLITLCKHIWLELLERTTKACLLLSLYITRMTMVSPQSIALKHSSRTI
jgi:hypothetical protein